MSNKVIGKYYDTSSLIHDVSSVIKIICTIIYACFCFISYNVYVNIVMITLVVLLMLLSRIPISYYSKPIWGIKWFLIFVFIINLVMGNDILITSFMVIKLVCVLLYTMILTYTTKQEDMVYGLQIVFSPLKILRIPVNKMAFSISLAIRFIPDLLNTYDSLLKSEKNRGISIKNLKIKDRISLLSTTISSIFIISLKKSDTLSDIMEARLYDVDKPLYQTKFRFRVFDTFIMMMHIALVLLIIRKGVMI